MSLMSGINPWLSLSARMSSAEARLDDIEADLLIIHQQILAMQTRFVVVDTSGTPGNATVSAFAGISAWSGSNTQCIITNSSFELLKAVSICPVEPGGALATVRWAQTDSELGLFKANRSTGSLPNQKFTWLVWQALA